MDDWSLKLVLATKRNAYTDDVLTLPTHICIVGRHASTKIDILNIIISNAVVAVGTFT